MATEFSCSWGGCRSGLAFYTIRGWLLGMASSFGSFLRVLWSKLPFPEMTVLVLALFVIKEQFPFSNFPMYSNIDAEADVIYVANQQDEPVAMKPLFKTSSGTSKKMFNTELKKLTNPSGRDSSQSTPEERMQAGKALLETLRGRLVKKAIPGGTTALRLYLRTFQAGESGVGQRRAELLAEAAL